MPSGFQPLFGQAADAYSAFRPEYPAGLYEQILSHVPMDHRERAMDLGAGTGKVTRVLLAHFVEVIAIEPDAHMAAKLTEENLRAVVRNVTAEKCTQSPGSVDLVTIANALHWMEGPRVMKNVAAWLRPNGLLAVIDPPFPKSPAPVRTIFKKEFDERWNAFRDARLGKAGSRTERPWQRLVCSTPGLALFEEKEFESIIPLSPRDLTGFCRSTSYGSAYARTLADPEAYWRGLESRFREAWPEDRIPVDFSPWLILARKE